MTTATTTIPALIVEARGEVTTSNVALVRSKVSDWLSTLLTDPKTDDDFVAMKEDIKIIKDVEVGFQSAKENALKQAEDLNKLFSELDEGTEEARQARLKREAILKVKTEEVKQSLIEEAMGDLMCADRLKDRLYGLRVSNAAKGKRTIDSIKKALGEQVACLNKTLLESRAIIEAKVSTHGEWIAPDADELETKNPDAVESELRRRFDKRKSDEEMAKVRAEAEAVKLQAAQQAPEPAKPTTEIPAATTAATIPVGTAKPMMSAEDEWKTIVERGIKPAFAIIRGFRESANHEINQKRLEAFRASCIEAFDAILKIENQ